MKLIVQPAHEAVVISLRECSNCIEVIASKADIHIVICSITTTGRIIISNSSEREIRHLKQWGFRINGVNNEVDHL